MSADSLLRDASVRVTIIIPAFNREKYDRQAIESVLAQTHQNMETIVVDDGSTDGTRSIIESFGDQVELLEHPGRENRGQSASINLGLSRSTGEFAAILNSDDYWLPDKLRLQLTYLHEHPEVGLVYGNGYAVDENGVWLYDIYEPGHEEQNRPASVLLDC